MVPGIIAQAKEYKNYECPGLQAVENNALNNSGYDKFLEIMKMNYKHKFEWFWYFLQKLINFEIWKFQFYI